MPKHLYVVTVETEFVFVSDSENVHTVGQEFQDALRDNYTMRDELDSDPDVRVTPMSYLPGQYSVTDLPWGDNEDDKTIQAFIDEGAAPKFVEHLKFHEKLKSVPPKLPPNET